MTPGASPAGFVARIGGSRALFVARVESSDRDFGRRGILEQLARVDLVGSAGQAVEQS
jgi:hypothetical protein